MAGIRIFTLLYGPHIALHRRLLESFRNFVPRDVPLNIWLNQVPDETKSLVEELRQHFPKIELFTRGDNHPKYLAMREMFRGFKDYNDQGTSFLYLEDWAVWFDDDSHITGADWYPATMAYLASKPDAWYIGQPWFVHWRDGQWDWVKSQPWYTGKDSEIIKGKLGVNFAQGAYWILKAGLIRFLDWPFNLKHNGGDVMLGEAVYQQGLPFHKFWHGVKVNDAPRRGYSEAPAGCKDKNVRI